MGANGSRAGRLNSAVPLLFSISGCRQYATRRAQTGSIQSPSVAGFSGISSDTPRPMNCTDGAPLPHAQWSCRGHRLHPLNGNRVDGVRRVGLPRRRLPAGNAGRLIVVVRWTPVAFSTLCPGLLVSTVRHIVWPGRARVVSRCGWQLPPTPACGPDDFPTADR